jgi:ATP-binding cassette, subfamily B, bacterial
VSEAAAAARESRARISLLLPALAFLRPYLGRVVIASVALVFTAAISLSLGQGLRIVVDDGFASGSPQMLQQAVLLFMVMVVLLGIGTFTRFYQVSWIGERVTADMRRAVFDHVIGLHPGYFETNGSGEIQSRITADTTLLQTVIGSSVSIALRSTLTLVGGTVLLFVSNPRLTAIVLISVPLVLIPIVVFGRRVRSLSRDSQDRLANAGAYVGEALANIKTVQAFNHEAEDRKRFGMHVEETFRVSVQRILQRSLLSTAAIVLVLGAIAAMIWVGGNDVMSGRTTPGELTSFIFYAVVVAVAMGALSEVIGDLQRAAGATERLMELLNEQPLIRSPTHPLPLPPRLRGEIEFEQLRFSYPSNPERAAIDGLSLLIPAGTSLALVGASGAGKSTLVDLLLRFYESTAGRILIDGTDSALFDPAQLRGQFALVPQQPVLFSGSVLDNIRYGVPEASEEQVLQAARAAYVDEFVELLPQRYDSFVGEGGVRLSGGQRQRIAIARALLRDPAILLLDEATSSLDADSENKVQRALQLLMQGRTTLVIAHRLATVRQVDRIVVLERGRIAAIGSHEQLLETSPLYAHWAALQFADGQGVG